MYMSARYRGHIRVQDVRYYDIDAVAIADCFRPGDLIKCKVVGWGWNGNVGGEEEESDIEAWLLIWRGLFV